MQPSKTVLFFMLFMLMVLTPLLLIKQRITYFSKVRTIPVLLLARAESKLYHLDLEDYVVGVVAAEMPAEFSLEALKAQAVAARTQAYRRLKRFGGKGSQYYPEADFSDDHTECQAWLSPKMLQAKWGYPDYQKYYQKIQQAVKETQGIIMVYQNKPIDAVFHSTCGVGTASAIEVWNYDIPYLKGVTCGFDKRSPRYRNSRFMTWPGLAGALNISEKNARQINVLKHSASGRVSLIGFGTYRISGKEFRQKLNLTSSCFSISKKAEGVYFEVIGYGHGVGLCQYGADGLAKIGWNYQKILCHYYQGINFRWIKY